MSRATRGSVYEKKGTWYLSLTILKVRKHIQLDGVASRNEAESRRAFAAQVLERLRKAGHESIATRMCTEAATLSTGNLPPFIRILDRLERGEVVVLAEPVSSEPKLMTFGELAEEYTSGKLARDYPHQIQVISHKENILRLNKHILPVRVGGIAVKDIPVADFTRRHADEIMRSPTIREGSLRHVAQLIRRLMNIASVTLQLIDRSPIPRGWVPKKQRPLEVGGYLLPEEERQLLLCTKVPLVRRIFFGFCIREGLRRGRALTLEWGQLQGGIPSPTGLKVECRIAGPRNKPGTRWNLQDDTAETLRRWKALCPPQNLIFPTDALPRHRRSRSGQPINMNKFAEVLRASLSTAGLTRAALFKSDFGTKWLRGHDLRRSFVTQARQGGAPDAYIQRRTAHSSKGMVDRYDAMPSRFDEGLAGGWSPMHLTIPELQGVKPELLNGEDGVFYFRSRIAEPRRSTG